MAMQEEIEQLLNKFWTMGKGISQFITMPDLCDVSEVKYFDVYSGNIRRDLVRTKIPLQEKSRLQLCLVLAEEMGVLNDFHFYMKKEERIQYFMGLVEKAKKLLGQEKELGLDRDFYKRDYDLMLIMESNKEYELMHDKISRMAKEISENYFSYLIQAEDELKKL